MLLKSMARHAPPPPPHTHTHTHFSSSAHFQQKVAAHCFLRSILSHCHCNSVDTRICIALAALCLDKRRNDKVVTNHQQTKEGCFVLGLYWHKDCCALPIDQVC